jgi:vacuolar protein sorting-associated protein 13A/C
LFTNSLHGTFNTASKVTGSIGQGLSFLTFDENYIREHQKQSTSKPNDIRQGLLDGSEAFAKSIYDV